jgi:hypothetical protein
MTPYILQSTIIKAKTCHTMCKPNKCMLKCKIYTAETQTHTKKKEGKKGRNKINVQNG